MLASLRNMFKVPDLRNKVLFTLLIIGVYLMGANIVVPGVNFSEIQTISAAEKSGGVLGFLNLFSGGALARAAIFGSDHALHHLLDHRAAIADVIRSSSSGASRGRSASESSLRQLVT